MKADEEKAAKYCSLEALEAAGGFSVKTPEQLSNVILSLQESIKKAERQKGITLEEVSDKRGSFMMG
mgnify:FL=1